MKDFILKVKVNHIDGAKEVIRKVKEIEKEHSCNCTLLEIETQD